MDGKTGSSEVYCGKCQGVRPNLLLLLVSCLSLYRVGQLVAVVYPDWLIAFVFSSFCLFLLWLVGNWQICPQNGGTSLIKVNLNRPGDGPPCMYSRGGRKAHNTRRDVQNWTSACRIISSPKSNLATFTMHNDISKSCALDDFLCIDLGHGQPVKVIFVLLQSSDRVC